MKKIRTLLNLILTQSLSARHVCPPRHVSGAGVFLSRSVGACIAMTKIKSLSAWSFSPSQLASLPLDPETRNYVRQVAIVDLSQKCPVLALWCAGAGRGVLLRAAHPLDHAPRAGGPQPGGARPPRPGPGRDGDHRLRGLGGGQPGAGGLGAHGTQVRGCQCRQASPAPLVFRYGGYQFGYWADQLGDGRAHLLGEWVT